MPRSWFRIHSEGPSSIVDNVKIYELSDRLFRWLILLWACSCRTDGRLPPLKIISHRLRKPERLVQQAIEELAVKKFIEKLGEVYAIHDWEQHQFQSDSSTERVQKFRKRSGNVSPVETEALQERSSHAGAHAGGRSVIVSVIDSVSGGSAEGDKKQISLADEFDRWIALYPNRVKTETARACWAMLINLGEITEQNLGEVFAGLKRWKDSAEWDKDGGKYIPAPAAFLMGNGKHNGRLWRDYPKPLIVEEPLWVDPTPQWDAELRAEAEEDARAEAEARVNAGR